MPKVYSFDTEVYSNYFLVKFQNVETMGIRYLEVFNGVMKTDLPVDLKAFMTNPNNLFVGFNSRNFDAVVLDAYFSGSDTERIKRVCDFIISQGKPHWITRRKFKLRETEFDHIDVQEPAHGVGVSLKGYMGRMGSKKMQDLPISPDVTLSRKQADAISTYCDNDVTGTTELYRSILPDLKLRETLSDLHGVDMRSKSGAQVAEAIFRVYLEGKGVSVAKRQTVVKPFKYRMPEWVSFESDVFNDMKTRVEDAVFEVSDAGKPKLPKELSKVMHFNDMKLKFGIGGIHSQEKKQSIVAPEGWLFSEKDVNSLYPSIIIEQQLYPEHLTSQFLDVYTKVYNDRFFSKGRCKELKAEIALLKGEKLERLAELERELALHSLIVDANKLNLNASYGKLGSPYSYLYSPELVVQTTITGQLSILMLIERLTKLGATITSANTDSVDVLRPADIDLDLDVECLKWELETGYELDDTPYVSKHSESVNSYVAVTPYGVKGKGTFASESLMKAPSRQVCPDAIKAYLRNGADIESHIRAETNPHKFVTVKRVTGGAVFDGEEIGKMIRFYHSTEGDAIRYLKNGNKVSTSDGCRPMMDLPDSLPDDLDYQWYINEAYKLLAAMGVSE